MSYERAVMVQDGRDPQDAALLLGSVHGLLEEERGNLSRVERLQAAMDVCPNGPTSETTCGRSATAAPDPWLDEGGRPCRGNRTRSARFEDFCAFWESTVNLNAAEDEERRDLQDAKPHCIAEDGRTVLRCSATADRVARAGVYELVEWFRPDRAYCAYDFFRKRNVDGEDAVRSESACLALACRCEIVVFSPARRASRKILERMHEFLCLLDARERITEYNQEVCRVNSYDGGSSLIRSFPSAVGVRR